MITVCPPLAHSLIDVSRSEEDAFPAGGNRGDACLTAADIANLGLDTNLNKAGYYKAGQICTVCPGTSAAQLFIAAAVVVILAFCGFKASQVMGAQATNNMKKIIESLQFFSLSLNMSIEWPGPVLNIGKYLEGFTFSIEFLRPECVATGLNWFNIFLAVFVPCRTRVDRRRGERQAWQVPL